MSFINDEMHQTRVNLIKEIESLSFEQFNAKPNRDKWSIAQICHHLVLVELATIKAIHYGIKANDHPTIKKKSIQLMLDRTKKIQAPKIVEPAHEKLKVQEIIDMLSDSRKKLLQTIHAIDDPLLLQKKLVKHPAFDDLSLDQWIELVYLHEQRHIKQIKELAPY